MTFQGSKSIYKQVTKSRQSLLQYIPDALQSSIVLALNHHYEELYEPESDGTVLLEDVLGEILDSFQNGNQLLSQLRYVWMALTLAVVVEPTIKYYQPDSSIPEETTKHLTNWLLKTLTEIFNLKDQLNVDFENIESITSTDFNQLFSEKCISSFQVLSEALDVYINAIKALEPNYTLQALLDILDDCLEGYAIFPGSYGRRELFNWWLIDVVPSCWYLLPPNRVYPLNELANNGSSALDRLEATSFLIWSLICPAIQNRKNKEPLHSCDNTFFVSTEQIEDQIKYNQFTLNGNKNI